MIIGIAGPYSAPSQKARKANLQRLEHIAAQVLTLGHTPLIGITAALPIIEKAKIQNPYQAIMDISIAVINACDALLLVEESPGANQERDFILAKGLPVYYTLEDLPLAATKSIDTAAQK